MLVALNVLDDVQVKLTKVYHLDQVHLNVMPLGDPTLLHLLIQVMVMCDEVVKVAEHVVVNVENLYDL